MRGKFTLTFGLSSSLILFLRAFFVPYFGKPLFANHCFISSLLRSLRFSTSNSRLNDFFDNFFWWVWTNGISTLVWLNLVHFWWSTIKSFAYKRLRNLVSSVQRLMWKWSKTYAEMASLMKTYALVRRAKFFTFQIHFHTPAQTSNLHAYHGTSFEFPTLEVTIHIYIALFVHMDLLEVYERLCEILNL